jgi:tetratricopeptide (TPR) repeat protein
VTDLPHDALKEHALRAHESPGDGVRRTVTVLIVAVTFLAAVTALLERRAETREADADRAAQRAILDVSVLQDRTSTRRVRDRLTFELAEDLFLRSDGFAAAGERGLATPYADALAASYDRSGRRLETFEARLFGGRHAGNDGRFDLERFDRAQAAPRIETVEYQKAYARERGGWSSKRGRYVTVITLLAFSLFLLGLTLTVPADARRPFLLGGCTVALAATAWLVQIVASPVDRPSRQAIGAYVSGTLKADYTTGASEGADRTRYVSAHADFDTAIAARPGYQEAYAARGSVRAALASLEHAGARGWGGARDDFERAVELDPDDFGSWGNLALARFWLGDYPGALDAIDEAIAVRPLEPRAELDRVLYLTLLGASAPAPERRLRLALGDVPAWLRRSATRSFVGFLSDVRRERPGLRAAVERVERRTREVGLEVAASLRSFQNPFPRRTTAVLSDVRLARRADGALELSFAHGGVAAGEIWLRDVYVDGRLVERLSSRPSPWAGPVSGSLVVPLGAGGPPFRAGAHVVVDLFFSGNLAASVELTVPGGRG